jgi:probable addiction module antidote protein
MAPKDEELKLADWDASENMQRGDYARLMLEEVARDRDAEEISSAVGDFARALGMKEIAKRTGMPIEDVYSAVNAWPRELEPLLALLNRLGIETAASRSDAAE